MIMYTCIYCILDHIFGNLLNCDQDGCYFSDSSVYLDKVSTNISVLMLVHPSLFYVEGRIIIIKWDNEKKWGKFEKEKYSVRSMLEIHKRLSGTPRHPLCVCVCVSVCNTRCVNGKLMDWCKRIKMCGILCDKHSNSTHTNTHTSVWHIEAGSHKMSKADCFHKGFYKHRCHRDESGITQTNKKTHLSFSYFRIEIFGEFEAERQWTTIFGKEHT